VQLGAAMKLLAIVAGLSLVACATEPEAVGTDEDYSPGLSPYARVFHGVPTNGSLLDIGKADAVYPAKSTELLATQSPVKDQNRRGVCTIFTTTALMEHLYIKAGMAMPSFSEQYLQWSVKTELGVFPDAEGSNISDNVEAVHRFGVVDEATDPYVGTQWTAADDAACAITGAEDQTLPTKCWTQGTPSDAIRTAKKYTLPEGKFINTTDIKAHITNEHTAVGVGIDFFYQAWNHGASTLPIDRSQMRAGIVRFPNAQDVIESHKARAGHGILIVGWDDDLQVQKVDAQDKPMVDGHGDPVMEKGFYIFKNSWGTAVFGVTNPNGAGYGYISEKYIEQYGTAYVVGVPDLTATPVPTPPPAPTCDFACADYGYVANQCEQGWACDPQGACLSPKTCP
jgi:C1A family cysteine protease